MSALCWHPPGAERRTIIRTIIAAALAAVLATPAAAHIPDGCESQFWALKYASATLRVAHEALDPTDARVEPLEEYIDALRETTAAGLELARCVDEGP